MIKKIRVVSLVVFVVGLFGIAMPSAATIPLLEWPKEDGEWYEIRISQYGLDVYSEWMQDTGDLCTETTCSLDLNEAMPFGLDAGDYDLFIRWWDAGAERIRNQGRQDLIMTTQSTSVSTVGGRIEITIPDNDLFDSVNIWIGTHDNWEQIPDLQNGWYTRADDMTCANGICTIFTDAHGADSNRYVAYLRYFDQETNTTGIWSAGFRFQLQTDRVRAVGGHAVTVNPNDSLTLSWNGSGNLTWYRVWFGGGGMAVDEWMKASAIGCHNGGTCEFTINESLNGGAVYSWYVHAWGPSGYPTGGISSSGWSAGEPLFVPGSNNAFVMQNDLLVIEAESTALVGDWTTRTSFGGFTGNSYITWRHGNTDDAVNRDYIDVMTYLIKVPAAGTYRLQMRASSPEPNDLYNDLWMRVLGEGAYFEAVDPSPGDGETDYENMGNDWFKVYNNRSQWRWQASHVDEDAHEVFFVVENPGEFAIQISGRSTQFRVDRFVFYNEDTITANQAEDLNNPESPRG